ncbi:hypothetical protein XELAEV_18026857mg [Xenopus laevis]|uniref:Uncharacterized protein n=1 Tax=Xenopus laevis TaxID=8355 RepID=A0A974CUI5_XENLA|nr:hypothetical protein XELAEV_18026857mg [Xenopus laevis]
MDTPAHYSHKMSELCLGCGVSSKASELMFSFGDDFAFGLLTHGNGVLFLNCFYFDTVISVTPSTAKTLQQSNCMTENAMNKDRCDVCIL